MPNKISTFLSRLTGSKTAKDSQPLPPAPKPTPEDTAAITALFQKSIGDFYAAKGQTPPELKFERIPQNPESMEAPGVPCGCRDGLLDSITPEKLDMSIKAFGEAFGAAIPEAVHARAQALKVTGVADASSVTTGKHGPGELALEISTHPKIQFLAAVLVQSALYARDHGAPITPADAVNVMAAQLGSIAVYAMTDMVTPAKTGN